MNLFTVIPAPYRIMLLAAFCAALVAFGWVKGARHVQARWDAAEGTRAQAVTTAVLARVSANQQEAQRQVAINKSITEEKDHEIAALTTRLASAGRLRVGPAICGRPAAPTETSGPAGSDGTDSSGRLVREDVDRDLKALILAVESDLAAGRACQAFILKHGFSQ